MLMLHLQFKFARWAGSHTAHCTNLPLASTGEAAIAINMPKNNQSHQNWLYNALPCESVACSI